MKRNRILHVLYSFLPVTQNWIYTQIKNNTSSDNYIISLIEDNPDQFPFKNRRAAFTTNSTTNRIGYLLARYRIRQPDTYFASMLHVLRPDIIHGHFATESWRILPHAKKNGTPLITTFYGLDVDKLPRRRYWKKRYPILFEYGSAFIVEGPFMGTRLLAAGCNREKLHVIPLGVDSSIYRQKDTMVHPNDTIQLLFTGLSREKKGPLDAARIFVAATRKNDRLRLSVIGDGNFRKPFKSIIAKAGLLDRVHFYGNCSFINYSKILSSTDIVLVPSCFAKDGDSEGGAPVVAIEAQMSGIPIIGTCHADLPFVVKNGESGFLSDEHDIDSMVSNLLLLAKNRDLRLNMGEVGRVTACRQHDVKKQVAALSELYNAVIAAQSPKKGNHEKS